MLARLPGEAIIGAGLVLLGAGMAWSISSLEIAAIYAKVGPAVIPYLVAACLVLIGGILFWQGRRKVDETSPSDLISLGALGLGLLVYAGLLKTIGFIIASSLLFFLVAWGFGSRNYVINVIAALALSVVIYFAFNAGLGLNLPKGPLEMAIS